MWCYHWVSIVFAVIIINRYWQQEEWSLLRSKQICAWLNKTSFIWIVGQGMLCSPWDFAAFIFFFEMSDIELRQKYWEKTLLPLLVLYFLFCGKLPLQSSCCFPDVYLDQTSHAMLCWQTLVPGFGSRVMATADFTAPSLLSRDQSSKELSDRRCWKQKLIHLGFGPYS